MEAVRQRIYIDIYMWDVTVHARFSRPYFSSVDANFFTVSCYAKGMKIFQPLKNFRAYLKYCRKHGHDWVYDSRTLGGDYIRCTRCHALDEYLPGTHEPVGYDPKTR